uniref:Uncharacterized protein n=1 Tax=Anopheles farauti TaxID=69004 RepID=A0A182QNL8_9DIPT
MFRKRCSYHHPSRNRTTGLLAEDDFTTGAKVLARLVRTLVCARLQPDDGLAGVQLLLGEVTLALVRRFRSEERALELGMLIHRLEDVQIGHTVLLDRLLEQVDVLHHLELTAGRVDLRHCTRFQLVDQLAQDQPITQRILVQDAGGELLTEHLLDPVLCLLILLQVALASDLRGKRYESDGKHLPLIGLISPFDWWEEALELGVVDRVVTDRQGEPGGLMSFGVVLPPFTDDFSLPGPPLLLLPLLLLLLVLLLLLLLLLLDTFCCAMRSCLRNLARRFWNQTCSEMRLRFGCGYPGARQKVGHDVPAVTIPITTLIVLIPVWIDPGGFERVEDRFNISLSSSDKKGLMATESPNREEPSCIWAEVKVVRIRRCLRFSASTESCPEYTLYDALIINGVSFIRFNNNNKKNDYLIHVKSTLNYLAQ